MPIDARELKRNQGPATIETERKCVGCGYNLQGLPVGGRCPECAMPTTEQSAFDDPLSLMPVKVIKTFRHGSWLASLCVLVAVGTVIIGPMFGLAAKPKYGILLGAALFWQAGVWMLTPAFDLPQAIRRGFSRQGRLRSVTRGLQTGWLAASGAAFAAQFIASPTPLVAGTLTVSAFGGLVVGIAGVVTLSILMERLAEWARDEDAERAFNWAMWGLPVVTPLLWVDLPFFVLNLLITLIWLIVVCSFPWGLLSMSKSITLSVVHAREHQDRERRRFERRERYYQRAVDSVASMDAVTEREAEGPAT